MDFSSNLLIDFGLNLAGYVIAALLIYLLAGMRRQRAAQPNRQEDTASSKCDPKIRKVNTSPAAAGPEFIPLTTARTDGCNANPVKAPGKIAEDADAKTLPATFSLQASRRAIYQEARRLLASGKTKSDLLRQLPLTDGELEMLTVAGKA